jgi:hypothetical protein
MIKSRKMRHVTHMGKMQAKYFSERNQRGNLLGYPQLVGG